METQQPLPKRFKAVRYLLSIATVISGWLSGATVDRFIIQFPSFRRIDILCWAQYSRHADLGNGVLLYPAEAIIPFILLLVAIIFILRGPNELKALRFPVFLSLILSFLGLFFTLFAVPVMLSLKHLPDDPSLLQSAFNHFYFWSSWRAIAQILLFFSCLWAWRSMIRLEERG